MPPTHAPSPTRAPSLVGLRAPPLFTCVRSDSRAGAVGVRLTGELDMATACRLDLALHDAQAAAAHVVLDLHDLTFMDCSGVRVILGAVQRGRRAGHRLTVVPGPAQVTRVFALTGAADAVDMSGGTS